jgi:predicted  nucleic acid-binding Zn-ribbon protein
MNKIDVKMTEIGKVRSQARTAVKRLEIRERSLVEAYRREGSQLVEQMKKDDAARVQVAARLSADLMTAYEEAVQRCGGVGVAHLEEGRCGACRNTIEPNRLLQVKRDAPVSHCPHCHRLLVIG